MKLSDDAAGDDFGFHACVKQMEDNADVRMDSETRKKRSAGQELTDTN
jgi:hypothetical protein